MPHTEPTVNAVLAGILRPMFARAVVAGEDTGGVTENAALQLDVLITAPGRSPVSIETEFMPARTVEEDALSRLGKTARRDAKTIEAVIAARYPEHLRNDDNVDIDAGLREARFSYAVFTQEGPENIIRTIRFPETGWLEGDLGDLANLARLVSVPQRAVEQASDNLQFGIEQAATVLGELDNTRGQINIDIAKVLGMENVEQTRRMASAIVANAMVFHERIVGMHPNARIKTLDAIAGPHAANPKGDLLESWRQVLAINYHPIFDIARRIIECLPTQPAARLIRILSESGNYVNVTGIDNAHDLTGRVFQRLISDRKYLATFYTRPASAALLAQLAIAKMEGVDWSNPQAIGELRIADMACGTGALLSAAYEQVASRHARAGGNPRNLHTAMMENVLIGCDVMPSSVHITAATLAGIEPDMPYSRANLYSMPYGLQSGGDVRLGSLEFLAANRVLTNMQESGTAMQVSSSGEVANDNVLAIVADESLDLVIMNPPFTSDTKHRDAKAGVLNAAFAAFETTKEVQSAMAKRLILLANDMSYHGHAGLGSAFFALAHKKVRPGGVVAFVLPFTAINGSSWAKFRGLVAKHYTDVTIVSIAANGHAMSFSSDTGMAECLIIGRKLSPRKKPSDKGAFISLRRRPNSFVEAQELSKVVLSGATPRRLEDGPYGGLPIYRGDVAAGELLDAPLDKHEAGWGAARILDASVAQTAHSLSKGNLWLPAESEARKLPIAFLEQVGQRGLDSQLFVSAAHKGPFTKEQPSPTATYPALWNHNATQETRLVCAPDFQLSVRQGMEPKAHVLWATAGRAHLNRDFTFGSQALAVAFTQRASIGGRVWPNVSFPNAQYDFAFTLWANSTLGLLCYWWHSSRQQSSKAGMTVRAAGSMPVLDFRELTDDQLATAEHIFEEFRDKELMPAYLADADPNRDLLDRRVVMDMLGFDEDIYLAVRRLAQKWCAEPSVHGGKARPRDARPIPGDS